MSGEGISEEPREHGPAFWVAAVVGWLIVGYGLWGMFDESNRTNPASLLWWIAGGIVVHDLIWLPLALLAGAAIARVVPRHGRRPVAWVCGMTSLLLIVGYPFIAGKGRRDDTPSLLNRDYGTGVAVYIAVIVVVGLAWWFAASRSAADQGAALKLNESAPDESPTNIEG